MANWEINDIPSKASALISSDNIEGQEAAGGTASGFKVSMADIEKYVLNAYGRINYKGTPIDLNPTTTPEQIPVDSGVSSAGVTSSIANNELVIERAGTYDAFIHVEASVIENSSYSVFIYKNDEVYTSLDVSTIKKETSFEIIFKGLLIGLVPTDVINLYVSSSEVGGTSFDLSYMNFQVNRVGTV